jgi:hypothetical protein
VLVLFLVLFSDRRPGRAAAGVTENPAENPAENPTAYDGSTATVEAPGAVVGPDGPSRR